MAKITIDDIAKKVNVSKSTVSRYLNGGSVKASTREKIQEMYQNGYMIFFGNLRNVYRIDTVII